MILQRLISEAAKIPDLSESVIQAIKELNQITEITSLADIEVLNSLVARPHACESIHRRKVKLKNVELAIVKARHASIDTEEEDFV